MRIFAAALLLAVSAVAFAGEFRESGAIPRARPSIAPLAAVSPAPISAPRPENPLEPLLSAVSPGPDPAPAAPPRVEEAAPASSAVRPDPATARRSEVEAAIAGGVASWGPGRTGQDLPASGRLFPAGLFAPLERAAAGRSKPRSAVASLAAPKAAAAPLFAAGSFKAALILAGVVLALASAVLLARGPLRGTAKFVWAFVTKPHAREFKIFRNSVSIGVLAGAFSPLFFGAPVGELFYLIGAAFALAVGFLAVAYAVLRLLPWAKLAAGRRKFAAMLLGAVMGLSLGAAPRVETGLFVEKASALHDLFASKKADIRAVPGDAMGAETMRLLSANPVGRRVLAGLRDREGRIQLPVFFVASADGEEARYEKGYDAVFIASDALQRHGWSVEKFLSDPAAQRRVVDDLELPMLHELVHAVQARGPILDRETWPYAHVMEFEFEAYATAHLYVHEMLKADPHADVDKRDFPFYEYRRMLESDLLAGLRDHVQDYPDDRYFDGPRWRAFYADLDARWPSLRVEGYVLLARRALPGNEKEARADLARAREVAAQYGLPQPNLMIPPAK